MKGIQQKNLFYLRRSGGASVVSYMPGTNEDIQIMAHKIETCWEECFTGLGEARFIKVS